MLVHRNIGANELIDLIKNRTIKGTQDKIDGYTMGIESDVPLVSFFASDYWWIDDRHPYEVWVDIPEHKLQYGKGIYYADENFEKTHVWNGRKGNIKYEVQEVYAEEYTVMDLRLIKTTKKPIRNVLTDILRDLNIQN